MIEAALLLWAVLATLAARSYRRKWLRAQQGWRESIAIARSANAGWKEANDTLIEAGTLITMAQEIVDAATPLYDPDTKGLVN